MITPLDVGGDADLARRVIVYARSLAPCLHALEDNDKADALAILRGALSAADTIARARGSAVKTRTAGDWTLTYLSERDMGSVFTMDDRAALRVLCPASAAEGSGPIGSFPEPVSYRNLWP